MKHLSTEVSASNFVRPSIAKEVLKTDWAIALSPIQNYFSINTGMMRSRSINLTVRDYHPKTRKFFYRSGYQTRDYKFSLE